MCAATPMVTASQGATFDGASVGLSQPGLEQWNAVARANAVRTVRGSHRVPSGGDGTTADRIRSADADVASRLEPGPVGMSKAEEKSAAEEFVRLLGLDANVASREGPDIELTFPGGRKVGLEVTEPHVEPQAKGFAVSKLLCKELEAALAARDIAAGVVLAVPHLYVGFSVLNADRRSQLAQELANLIEGDAPRLLAGSVTHDRAQLGALHIDEITEIAVYPREGEALVGTRSGGMGSRGGVAQLGIDKKNEKVDQYRETMGGAEQWLLLVTGRSTSSSIWSHVLEDEFLSGFDRTFVLDYFEGRAFELETKRAPPAR